MNAHRPELSDSELRQVRAYGRMSGLSGIAFAVLLTVALVLMQRAPGVGVPDSVYTAFYNGGADVLVTVGLNIVPFAGIAFLWHMIAMRAMLGAYPGEPSAIPHGLQLASGVIWVSLLFAGTAAVGAVALLTVFSTAALPGVDVARALTSVGYAFVFVYGVRAAGMYMITTTTLAGPTGILPRWLALLGYLAAAFLLVSTTYHPAVLLVFPVWVVVMSVAVLVRAGRRPA
ncbi:MAG: hypothetical protein ACT4RN_16490 [Pseudonocardia sp.]